MTSDTDAPQPPHLKKKNSASGGGVPLDPLPEPFLDSLGAKPTENAKTFQLGVGWGVALWTPSPGPGGGGVSLHIFWYYIQTSPAGMDRLFEKF